MKNQLTAVLWLFWLLLGMPNLSGQDYDLELTKATIAAGISSYGVAVPFNITVTNNGTLDVANVGIVDYVPTGYEFVQADNPRWVFDNPSRRATRTIVGPIGAGVDSLITIFLRPIPVADAADWINAAEIFQAQDLAGGDIGSLDLDSNYDSIQGNMDALEDDYDEASAFVYDLALRKNLSPGMVDYSYGDNIDFEITVFNQGSDTVQDVQVREFFAEGFSYDQSLNAGAGWFDDEPIPYARITETIAPGDSATITITLGLTQMMFDSRAWDNYATIDSAFTTSGLALTSDADSTPGSNTIAENAVLPGSSDDDNILGGGPNAGEDEDDHDVALVEIFDFALVKLREFTVAPSFSFGQTVIFNNSVYNQGNQGADSVIIVDYVPCGYRFVDFINPGWTYDSIARKAYYDLVPGPDPASETIVPIVLVVQPCFDDPTTNWVNNAELAAVVDTFGIRRSDIDSTPDDTQENDAGGVVDDGVTDNQLDGLGVMDEDDSDPATLEIVDWALKLTIESPDTVQYGENVRFKVTGYNQGNIDFASADVLVDLGVGYSYDQLNNPGWSASMTEPQFNFAGPISPGDSVEAFLDLTLLESQNVEDEWVNYARLVRLRDNTGNRDDDADSFPSDTPQENSVKPGDPDDDNIFARGTNFMEDQDDHDPAGPNIFDLSLHKSTDLNLNGYKYGEVITFDVTVVNEGSQVATNVSIIDKLPCGLVYLPSNDGLWSYDLGLNQATAAIVENIAPGDSATLPIDLRLEYCVGLDSYVNRSEVVSAFTLGGEPVADIDSTPDNDDPTEDDQDTTSIPVVDLALTKRMTTTMLAVGLPVVFEITIHNQGSVAVEDIRVIDYLPDGYTLNDQQWSVTSLGNVSIVLEEPLSPGSSRVIQLNTTLTEASSLADYINYAEVAGFAGVDGQPIPSTDSDSNPASNTPEEQAVQLGGAEDGNISGGGPTVNEDEDDHDVGGFNPFGSIGDFVWKDLNYNGVQDAGEPGIADVSVSLQTCAGATLATVESDANGLYSFDQVLLGDYQLVFDLSDVDGCIVTLKDQGLSDTQDSDIDETGTSECFTVAPQQVIDALDAGFAGLADVGDYVWEDLDGDGFQDNNEPGIPNVTVTLFDRWGNAELTTTTDAQGFYLFEDVSVGRYYMGFETGDPLLLPTVVGLNNSEALDSNVDDSNGSGTTSMFDLAANDDNLSIDAGYYRCVTICGKTWLDLDGNDLRDINENGINGMLVSLYRLDNNGVYVLDDQVATGLEPGTNSGDGYFEACLRPGTYYIEVPPAAQGLILADVILTGNPFLNSDVADFNGPNTSASFTLGSGSSKCDLGVGYAFTSCLRGLVWVDANVDGLRAPSESTLDSVLVELYNDQNQLIASRYTDTNGIYEIEDLKGADYYLVFYPSSFYTFTQPLADQQSPTTDSDVDQTNGVGSTRMLSLAPGDCLLHLDAGLLAPTLPVIWEDISVDAEDDTHILNWSTSVEINASYYHVQRSINGGDWTGLGEVRAENNPSGAAYQWTANDTRDAGVYRYRLEQYDLDGRSAYSDVVSIRVDHKGEILLYPNPAASATTLSLPAGYEARVIITGQDGAKVYEQLVQLNETSTTLHDIDVSRLTAGVYQLTTIVGDQQKSLPLLVVR